LKWFDLNYVFWSKLHMSVNRATRTRRKAVRPDSYNRYAYVACVLLAFSWTLIHFRHDIPALFSGSTPSQENKVDPLNGSILVFPHDSGNCRQRVIDNTTGQIRDNGFVDCAAAEARSADAWNERMSRQRAGAIRDSFVNK
jgi:hypothetical protein